MNEQQAQIIVDNLTETQKEELQGYLKKDKRYLWIAKKLKISAVAVRNYDILVNRKYVVSSDDYGRRELRKFIISRRYIDEAWPAKDDDVIERTRKEYDEGKVEMVTARDGFYQLLYRIPRKITDKKRKPYFKRGEFNVE